MDGFTFISEIVEALAWPSATIGLVYLLRNPISQLIPLIKKLKFKEIELEFSQAIRELESEKSEVLPDIDKENQPVQAQFANATNLVSYSTRAAIIEAWAGLEAAAVSIASSFWNKSSNEVFRNKLELGDYLLQCKVLNEKQLTFYKKLHDLRNKSIHAEEFSLGQSDTRIYVEMANDLAKYFKRVEKNLKDF